MKRKRRVWFFVIAMPIIAVGVLLFVGTRENPDYVRAAALLPDAKARALEMFAPMTWDEYRRENGIVYRDDSRAWTQLSDSIPNSLGDFRNLNPPQPDRFGALFTTNRVWLLGLPKQIEPLSIHQMSESTMIGGNTMAPRSLVIYLAIGLVGAADVGDVAAVEAMATAAWSIIDKFAEEPELMSALMIRSEGVTILGALLSAVIRNPSDSALATAVERLLGMAPALPDFRGVRAGEARSNHLIFEELQQFDQSKLNEALDSLLDSDFDDDYSDPSVGDKINDFLAGLGGKNRGNRRLGEHVIDALEARFWEVQVDILELGEEALRNRPFRSTRLERFEEDLARRRDGSYEVAAQFSLTVGTRIWVTHPLSHDLAVMAFDLITEYPSLESLPNAINADRLIPDPFSKGSILFKKTSTGFVLYSVYLDGVDGGYIPNTSLWNQRDNVRISVGEGKRDFGIVVNYVLPKAEPLPESLLPRKR